MRVIVFAAALLIATAAPASAQNVALRGPAPVPPGIDAPTRRLPETRRLGMPHDRSAYPAPAATSSARPFQTPADVGAIAGAPLPLLGAFEGAEYDGNSLDHEVAAGPESLLIATNDGIALKNKSGAVIAWLRGMTAFFDSVRQPQEPVGDPRVIYDAASGRFFVASIGARASICTPGTCVAHFFIAVSKDSTPASLDVADWHFYALDSTLDGDTPTARWADFVQMGVNDAVVILSARMHAFGGGSPSRHKIRILDKSLLVRGHPVSWTDFVDVKDPDSGISGFVPVVHLDRSDRFFLVRGCWGTDAAAVTVLEIKDALASPSLSFRAVPMNGCQGQDWVKAPQPNGRPLNVGGPGTPVFRNHSLWNVESTVVESGDTRVQGVLWYQLDLRPGAPAIQQRGVLAGPAVHYFAPALVVDAADNMAMVVGRSSAEEPLSLYYTGRLAGDPAGSLRVPALLKAGTATLAVEEDRVGDYYGAALDAEDGSAWLVGHFASGSAETTSWVGRVGLPGAGGRQRR